MRERRMRFMGVARVWLWVVLADIRRREKRRRGMGTGLTLLGRALVLRLLRGIRYCLLFVGGE